MSALDWGAALAAVIEAFATRAELSNDHRCDVDDTGTGAPASASRVRYRCFRTSIRSQTRSSRAAREGVVRPRENSSLFNLTATNDERADQPNLLHPALLPNLRSISKGAL